jgi:hypothetical protein
LIGMHGSLQRLGTTNPAESTQVESSGIPGFVARRVWGARDADPVDLSLVRALIVGRSLARLVDGTCLGSQNRDADILTGFDVVRIVQRGVQLMNLA